MTKNIEKFKDTHDSKKDSLLTNNYALNSSVNPSNNDLDLDEKTTDKKLFTVVLLIAIVMVGFLFWYNSSQFSKSLAVDVPDWALAQLEIKTEEEEIADLKAKDTDHDGLTDYVELYQYGTSIFLADTDSDGYTDHEEVLQGYDPLCPTGEDCSLLKLITPKTKLAEVVQELSDSDVNIEEAILVEFKIFLSENGISQEDIDSMTDEELLEILAVMSETESDNINNSSTTPDQVRQFLLTQPDADEEIVNSLTDEELMQIQEILSNN